MYDKLKIWIDRYDIGEQYPNIATFLDEAKEQTDLRTGEVSIYGHKEGLRVSIYAGGLSIVGSLPKFLYGSNIYPLDMAATRQALEKMADELHIPLEGAKVTGLEFGANFVLEREPKEYLDRLGDMPRLQRVRYNSDTLYYKHRGKQQPKTFCYYDKIAEAKDKKMEIPVGLEDTNLLRCEMRLNGRLPYQIGVPEVTASTLYDRPFYRKLLQRFQDGYFSISKSNRLKDNIMSEIKTVSDAFNVYVARLINQSEKAQISDFLDELRRADVFKDRVSYTRLKQKIESVANMANLTISDELIKELDDEFKNTGAYV